MPTSGAVAGGGRGGAGESGVRTLEGAEEESGPLGFVVHELCHLDQLYRVFERC